MKAIDTGSEPANRLLNLLATYVSKKMPWLADQWIAGDIEMDFNYVFLEKTRVLRWIAKTFRMCLHT